MSKRPNYSIGKVSELQKHVKQLKSKLTAMEGLYAKLKFQFASEVRLRTAGLETRCLKLSQRNSVLEERVQKMETLFVEAKKALAENEQYRRLHGRLPSVIPLAEEPGMADRIAAVEADSVLGYRRMFLEGNTRDKEATNV